MGPELIKVGSQYTTAHHSYLVVRVYRVYFLRPTKYSPPMRVTRTKEKQSQSKRPSYQGKFVGYYKGRKSLKKNISEVREDRLSS